MKFGETMYPGIKNAEVVYVDDHSNLPDGLTVEELYSRGDIALGIFGSRHDEHSRDGEERKAPCSATLVFKELGLHDQLRFKGMLKYFEQNDEDRKNDGKYDWANTIIDLHDAGFPPKMVQTWAFMAFDAAYKKEVRFEAAEGEFARKARERQFRTTFPDKAHTMVTIQSDNDQMGRYIRSRGLSGAVVQKASGNVIVISNHAIKPDMEEVVVELRRAEAKLRGIDYTEADLWLEGSFAGWYWQKKGQMVLNGSKTAAVEPTRLSLQAIEQIFVHYAKFLAKK